MAADGEDAEGRCKAGGRTAQLGSFGYVQEKVTTLPITQSKNVVIYHLVFATKSSLGNKI